MKPKLLLTLALVLGVPLLSFCAEDEPDEPGTNLQDLTLSIRCTNSVFRMGDEIPVEFVISNGGTANFAYDNCNSDTGVRIPEYSLTVQTTDGKTLPDPQAKYPPGFSEYLSTTWVLCPGESYTNPIPLNLWAIPPGPGQYIVRGTYLGGNGGFDAIQPPSGIHSAPITITVLPRTEAEMEAYICDLTNELAEAKLKRQEWDPILGRLAFTCSPKIVPFMLNEMYLGRYGYWEDEALVIYVPHSEAIRRQIVAAVCNRGLASGMGYLLDQYHGTDKEWRRAIECSLAKNNPVCWEEGALSAQNHMDNVFMPRLIDIALNSTNNFSRLPAINALSYTRTDATVRALKALLNNTNADVRLTAAYAVRRAYTHRKWPQGRPFRPDDFDVKYQQPYKFPNPGETNTTHVGELNL